MKILFYTLALLFAAAAIKVVVAMVDNRPEVVLWLGLAAALALGIDWLDRRLERREKRRCGVLK